MKSKQVIILRKDLNMRKGKMVAQGSHASMKVILDLMKSEMLMTSTSDYYADEVEVRTLSLPNESALKDWINGIFTKVCVSVDSEEELISIYETAKSMGIPCSMIVDAGLTEFGGVPTKTAVAIGPDWEDKINEVTGHLKLL